MFLNRLNRVYEIRTSPQFVEQQVNDENDTEEQGTSAAIDKDLP